MTVVSNKLDHPLAEIAGRGLLQIEPYPVVSARTPEMIRRIMQYARQSGFKLMPLGTGSSFDADFSLTRTDVIALMLAENRGIEAVSAERVRVQAGTEVGRVIQSTMEGVRRTMGGLLCDSLHYESSRLRDTLSPYLISLEVLSGDGEHIHLSFGGWSHSRDFGLANLFCGSNGRMGIVLSVDLQWNGIAPIMDTANHERVEHSMAGHREACLSRAELMSQFDSHGLFQW